MQTAGSFIKTSSNITPMIYAYTTPGVTYHDGWIKIGYTEHDVDKRIKEQTHTAGITAKKEWSGKAVYLDGSDRTFTDKDFHKYLRLNGVHYDDSANNEWFKLTPNDAKKYFDAFVKNSFIGLAHDEISQYRLREEQIDAVNKTIEYAKNHGGNFLWNAKPRFGKTLCVYDLMMKIKAEKVLIVTNRPVIANSWYQDYEKFVGRDNGYFFVSALRELRRVSSSPAMSYQEYQKNLSRDKKLIYFVSLQDLKGSKYFGGTYDKLNEIREISWNILVVDEAHEGVDTSKTDSAFANIKRNFALYLSGTPFKALAGNKFPDDAIFNWTYADEQYRREHWDSEEDNPYETLPKLNLFTYQVGEIFRNKESLGQFDFSLNEFFAVKDGKFVHDDSVDKFLDTLTANKNFPFSTPELRDELKHTFWLLNRVESAKLLAEKLRKHPVFENYEIILAAGDGKINDNDNAAIAKSYNKVVEVIRNKDNNYKDKTITLSVGQLTTGVTIPEWTGVLILSDIQSEAMYMQAAFRAQNSCMFRDGKKFLRKNNAYVFDFDPARSLVIYEKFANNLSPSASSEGSIKSFLNFFPVICGDSGEMKELDPLEILSVPKRIKSHEIVESGFVSDFLFSNSFNMVQPSSEIIKIIQKIAHGKFSTGIKESLREFSKTIPAFLMAYGDDKVTLENFASIMPPLVFEELTGITPGEFEILREAKIFSEVEFNDAVKEFMKLRYGLADYFESSDRDIFDYIPSPKSGMIFTPRSVVVKMLDALENENPGCFDDPEKTFIDPCMKSGRFIAEIVKRLYNSEKLKKIFPDKTERLKHIFEKQVFGNAPAEINYEMAKNFLLDFDKSKK